MPPPDHGVSHAKRLLRYSLVRDIWKSMYRITNRQSVHASRLRFSTRGRRVCRSAILIPSWEATYDPFHHLRKYTRCGHHVPGLASRGSIAQSGPSRLRGGRSELATPRHTYTHPRRGETLANIKSQRGHHGRDAERHLIRKVRVMAIIVTAGEVNAGDVIAVEQPALLPV
jgi:hypothetical protein